MRPYRWHRTLALWLLGGVLAGVAAAAVALWLTHRSSIDIDLAPNLQHTSGPYRATVERVSISRAGAFGARRLRLTARVERTDGKGLAALSSLWVAEEMADIIDGKGEVLSEGERQTEAWRVLGGRGYELRYSWLLAGRPVSPLQVTLRWPAEVQPDVAAPLTEGDTETILQAPSGSPSVLVRSVQISAGPVPPVRDPGPCLLIVLADARRIRGSGLLPAIHIAVRDASGQRMDQYHEWPRDAAQPGQPRDLCRAYPIAGHSGPFTLELTSHETYRQGLVEFRFEAIDLK